jgi:hypothetical protein
MLVLANHLATPARRFEGNGGEKYPNELSKPRAVAHSPLKECSAVADTFKGCGRAARAIWRRT